MYEISDIAVDIIHLCVHHVLRYKARNKSCLSSFFSTWKEE